MDYFKLRATQRGAYLYGLGICKNILSFASHYSGRLGPGGKTSITLWFENFHETLYLDINLQVRLQEVCYIAHLGCSIQIGSLPLCDLTQMHPVTPWRWPHLLRSRTQCGSAKTIHFPSGLFTYNILPLVSPPGC